ncbi:asparagine synthase-related protein [Rhizobacter fulvus]|jgi:asparagine synthase (glutamine-hydrolysing)
MFRYVGLAWDDSRPATSIRAWQLALALEIRSGWNAALVRSGLQVYTTGTRPGINGGYALPGERGVVLGKLFRRRDLRTPTTTDVTLTRAEGEQIVQSNGRALVRDFWGRYVAFLETQDGSTCVLRDPSGTLPCFRVLHEGVSIVFSWLEDVLEMLPDVDAPRPNWDAVAAFIQLGALGGRETALDGLSQILAGEALDLRSDASTFYWSAVDIARSPTAYTFAEAEPLLRETVRACTRSWAACYQAILFRLSGGVDSSILLSCLAPGATAADVLCVNYHSAGSNSDEREYARLAAGRVVRDLIERERNRDFRIERVSGAARMPAPINYIGWMNATTDARLASAHAAAALFTGAGGDPLFFEFRRWWPAADYLQLRGADRGFPAAALDAARLGGVSIWRTLALAAAERVWPRVATHESSGQTTVFFGDEILKMPLRRERFVHPHLLDPRTPVGKYMQTASLMHPLGHYDPFEQTAAPELVHPLLSQPLVELCLGLPTYLLTQGGRGRALARRAFASELPARIAARRSKGGMEEHLKDVLASNLEFARGVLMDGELVRRGLLDRAAIETVLSGKPTSLPGSPGHIHAFLGVELWLARWPR